MSELHFSLISVRMARTACVPATVFCAQELQGKPFAADVGLLWADDVRGPGAHKRLAFRITRLFNKYSSLVTQVKRLSAVGRGDFNGRLSYNTWSQIQREGFA